MKRDIPSRVALKSPPGRLPVEIGVSSASRVIGILGGGLFVIVGLNFALGQDGGEAARWIGIAAVAAGGLVALSGLRAVARRQQIRIDERTVSVTERGWTGSSSWEEPLSAYDGVRWRRYVVNTDSDDSSDRHSRHYIHVIDLAHPDPAKSVPLFRERAGRPGLGQVFDVLKQSAIAARDDTEAARDELDARTEETLRTAGGNDPRQHWETFARLFELPAIDARDGVTEVREAADLDKSLKERAAEGSIDAGWTDDPPPEQLEVQGPDGQGKDMLKVVIHANELPLWINALFVVFGVLILLGSFWGNGSVLFGLVFIGAGVGVWYLQKSNPRSVTITREALTYTVPAVQSKGFTVPLSAIESVNIRDADSAATTGRTLKLSGRELLVSTDTREHAMGSGLSREALEWLRRYIVSAAAHA